MPYLLNVKPATWSHFLVRCEAKKRVAIFLVAMVGIVGFAVLFATAKLRSQSLPASTTSSPPSHTLPMTIEVGKQHSVRVPEEVEVSLGMRRGGSDQVFVASLPTSRRSLITPGSTEIDPSCLIRVRVRFAPAEVVEIGKTDDTHVSPGRERPVRRDLQAGDMSAKVTCWPCSTASIWATRKTTSSTPSRKLRLDQEVLKRAENHAEVVPEVLLLNAQRNVQADLNAVSRAENTLKTWTVPDDEIQAVRDEVKSVTNEIDRRAKANERLKQWARVELRRPEDGVIIEQNVALHETVVDNTTNLIQIAKVDPLIVLASVPEDDLPSLQELKLHTHNNMQWTVRTVGSRPIIGFIDDIGYLIDPNQHTAVIRGHIPNADGTLPPPDSSSRRR